MKLTILFTVLVVLVAMTSAAKPCTCTEEYLPVCGEDGQTYGNECGMNCAGVKLAYGGTCGRPILITGQKRRL